MFSGMMMMMMMMMMLLTTKLNAQQMLKVLVSGVRPVAGRPKASGYAAPGYACALACVPVFQPNANQLLATRGPTSPPPCTQQFDFSWLPLLIRIFAEQIRKLEANEDPKVFKKSTNIFKNPPQGNPGT